MTDNLTMIRHRADEVCEVFEHIKRKLMHNQPKSEDMFLVSAADCVALTAITFQSVHTQFEGGRLASAVLETGVRAENGFRAVADSIVHVAGQPQAEGT